MFYGLNCFFDGSNFFDRKCRFLGPDRPNQTRPYTTFSGGRHACIGESYAYMQIKAIWSHLLRNFELKLESPFPETNWSKISPEPNGKVIVGYKRQLLPTN
jgi:sterol 14alpha-demethylase